MMQKIALAALLITLSVAAGVSQAASEGRPVDRRDVPPVPPPWTRRPLVQIAVVLDAGRGMSGLIHQAKTEIWPIVNEMLFTTKDRKPPIVQLAILTQGGSENPLGDADTQILTPFTINYDAIFSRLNMLRTGDNATDDYVRSIRAALRRLQWSPYPEDLKILFVAGDGWFTRGDDELASACQEAIDSGIIINTPGFSLCHSRARGNPEPFTFCSVILPFALCFLPSSAPPAKASPVGCDFSHH